MQKFKVPPKVKGLIFDKKEILAAKHLKPGSKGSILNITLEIPCDCNLKCPYCFTNFGERKKSELKLDEICSVLEQAATMGTKSVVIDGAGEPLLDFRLTKKVLICINNNNMIPVVFTNGMFASNKVAKWLFQNNATVIAKLNSLNPNIQDQLVGVQGSFYLMKKGIKNLINTGFSIEGRLAVQSAITAINYKDLPNLWKWMRRKKIVPFVETFSCVGKGIENQATLAVEPKKLKKLFFALLKIDEKEFGYSWAPHLPYVASNCNRCYYTAHVDSTGNVKPCPLLPIIGGNVRESTLEDILSRKIFFYMKNIDRHIRNIGSNKCSKCELLGECYGCRSRAYILSKKNSEQLKLTDEDPLCWKL